MRASAAARCSATSAWISYSRCAIEAKSSATGYKAASLSVDRKSCAGTGCRIVKDPPHLSDILCAGRDHCEPIEAERDPGTWRQAKGKRGQKVLIERPIRAGCRVAPRPISHEPGTLF